MRSARDAVYAAFFINGFAFASWASRIPDVRHALGLSDAHLGLLLLGPSIGSVAALALSGALVHRWGAGRVVRAGSVLVALALAGVAVAVSVGTAIGAWIALIGYGVGTGAWDVAMNVEAAEVERRLGRSIMPRFHAAFSLGTVVGAALGALMAHLSRELLWHLPAAAAVMLAVVLLTSRGFVPVAADHDPTSSSGSRAAWRERRTLLIGLIVLSMALTEGVANDWLAVGLQDGYHAARSLAVLGYALFLTSMTIGRSCGPLLLDRYGRVRVLYATATAAAAGVVLVTLGGPWLAGPGIVAWGLGASLGFPIGMSAAADDARRAAARVSVVSTIGYTAFFVGPPVIGAIAARVGTLHALLALLAVLGAAAVVLPAARPTPSEV